MSDALRLDFDESAGMRPIAPRSHAGNYRCSSGRLCGQPPLRSLPSPRQRVRRAIIYPAALTDTFYTSPADLADHRPGGVLAARPVSAPAGFLNTDGSAAEVPVDEFDRSPHCCGDHNSFTSRRRAGSGCCCRITHIINALGLGCAPSTAMYTDDLQARDPRSP
ncbi:hypothetical protein [Rhodococcus sp. AQ5-07]|uniref:hypothetical protein n=1 Tax=Rhodococcus sp. AQ5-07 TaxID=2054902 RepID=UPI001E5B165C|nr:hypothetical protein [Rhodococcus sp. AQ5-07]